MLRNLGPAIDIIPLQKSSNEAVMSTIGRNQMVDESMSGQRSDPELLDRVQKYLCENVDQVYIDVTKMADCLQQTYSNYSKRNRIRFRALVRSAYDEITETINKSEQEMERNDYDDEVEIDSDTPNNNALSKDLFKLYKKRAEEQNGNSSDKELIDLSSDDDDGGKVEDITLEKNRPSISRFKAVYTQAASTPKPVKEVASKQDADESVQITDSIENKSSVKTKKRLREKTINDFPVAKKKKESTVASQDSQFKFADIGGNKKVLENICRLLVHIKHPEIFKQIGSSPPTGFLLHGPPGCGKTLMAHAIAGELDIPLIKVAAPELIGGVSGESESRIRELFDRAVASAPCVLFLDEIDAMAPNRATAQREMERRIVAQLLSCLDELKMRENGEKVLVLGATNRPESMDPALRRAGRFDREVSLGIPDKESRAQILKVHASKLSLADDVDLMRIASLTPGFVGADLVSLLTEATIAAVDRIFKNLNAEKKKNEPVEIKITDNESKSNTKDTKEPEEVQINDDEKDETEKETSKDKEQSDAKKDSESTPKPSTSSAPVENGIIEVPSNTEQNDEKDQIDELKTLLKLLHDKNPIPSAQLSTLRIENVDFDSAFRVVQPSSKREGFATVPDVTWDDIGSLKNIREDLQMTILAAVKHSKEFEAFGLSTPTGVLLCGPPGCGKTLLAKAIANEAEINFISVKGPELLNMYVGESEKAVRQCFIRARNSAPCVIFFDELDALCPKRTEGDNSATSRVVNQVLTEMDGIEGRKGVYLMAATNRPDIIDPAVLRPGRFDKILYVGLPTAADRIDIIKAITKNGTKPKFDSDVSIEEIGQNPKCDGFTGADLASLIREAGVEAMRESMSSANKLTEIYKRHIDLAFNKVRPSVLQKDVKHYEKLRKLYGQNEVVAGTDATDAVDPMDDTPMIDNTVEAMET